MDRPALPPLHFALALAVTFVWGVNFVVIKAGLQHLPPLTFAALRFTLAFLPAALFLKRPKVPLWNLATYGVLIGVGQFGLLFIAMKSLISPGLASLVVQMQVFFTVGLAMWLSGERVRPYQVAALGLAGAGLAWLVAHTNAEVKPLGLILVLCAALSWAGGNIAARANGGVNMLAYVVWASLFSAPPLFALAFALEGWQAVTTSIAHADLGTWAAVVWQSVGNTLFGYAAWGWLLARHPAAVISPLSLLVPVFGMAASAIILGETLPAWKLTAAVLVLSGLALNVFWPRLVSRFRAAPAA
jgi:O-acetylserine/cysteine efflux transporter